jgi:small subunit ribosomal protein S20
MANHKSSLKRIRANETRRIRNRYYSKTMRNAVRKFRSLENKTEASEKLPKLISMIDKLARKTIIHKNKAGNLKSKLTRLVNKMA